MAIAQTIEHVKSGVVRLAFFSDHEQVGTGTGFLSRGVLITNSHVVRGASYSAVEMTFGDQAEGAPPPIRLRRDDFQGRIKDESDESHFDYAVIDISAEPETAGRHQFEVDSAEAVARVGDQVLFFGFPFGSDVLTSHVGYISAETQSGGVHRLKIDGSVNVGNSGGPLLHLESDRVIGIVTRTQTGLENDFDELVEALAKNEEVLSRQGGAKMTIGGVDPVRAIRVTMTALRRVAVNLRRSSNVGIGWAFCSEHLLAPDSFRPAGSK